MDAVEDSIPCVEGFALNVHLGNQPFLPRHMHREVDVWRAPWIRHGSYGAEPVLPLLVHLELQTYGVIPNR